jgi:TP901 family phage tail tape measure protein
MAQKQEFKLVISTVDNATAGIRAIKSQLQGVLAPLAAIQNQYASIRREIEPMQRALAGVRVATDKMVSVSNKLAIPVLAIGGYALKQSSDFEAATNRVKVLAGFAEDYNDVAQKAIRDLRTSARELAKPLPLGPTAIMDAYAILLGNDPDVAKAKEQIKPTINLALAGKVTPEESAKIIQGYVQTFKGVSPLQASNLLAKLMASSAVELKDFGDSLRNFAGIANVKNMKGDEILAASGVLSKSLTVGSRAGEVIMMMIRELSRSAIDKNKQEAMIKMGIKRSEIFQKNGQMKGFSELSEVLAKHVNSPYLGDVVGQDAVAPLQFLFSHMTEFRALNNELKTQYKATEESGSAFLQAKVQTEGLKGSVQQLRGSLEELALKMGDAGLLRAATDLIRQFQKLVDWIGTFDERTVKIGLAISGLTLAAAAFGNMLKGLLGIAEFATPALALLAGKFAKVGVEAAAASAAVEGLAVATKTATLTAPAGTPALGGLAGPIALGSAALIGATLITKMGADAAAQDFYSENLGTARNSRVTIKSIMDAKKSSVQNAAIERSLINIRQGSRFGSDEERKKNEELALSRLAGPGAGIIPSSNDRLTIDIKGLPYGSTVKPDPGNKKNFDLNLGWVMQQ